MQPSPAADGDSLSPTDVALERAVLQLLAGRSAGASICPSDASRAVAADEWRPLMDASRAAAQRLRMAGLVEVTQGGVVVDPSTARGPIRIRRSQ